jgi:hypothetical protein
MINDCSSEVWFVLSLAEDILLDTILLKSLEDYASFIKKFDVSEGFQDQILSNALGLWECRLSHGGLGAFRIVPCKKH